MLHYHHWHKKLSNVFIFVHTYVHWKILGRARPKNFIWTDAFVADTAAVNPNGTKMLLGNGVSTLFINVNQLSFKKIEKSSFLTNNFLSSSFQQNYSRPNYFHNIFISLFVSFIPEPLPVIYSLLNLSICLSKKSFPKSLVIYIPFFLDSIKYCQKKLCCK